MARGETGEEDGLVRGPSKHGHVDWWIYRNHDVSSRFHDVTEEILTPEEGE